MDAPLSFFTAEEARALGALADQMIPPDDTPGGAALGAVAYLDGLLSAFDSDPPRLYPRGPFSGRYPFPAADGGPSTRFPENGFRTFMPLNRVQALGWRLRLWGSAATPGGGPNDGVLGPVVGLRDRIRDGLHQLMQAAPSPLETLDPEVLNTLFRTAPQDFRNALVDLMLEGVLGAPEYGGNRDLGGWRLVHFEGDTLPLGFSGYDPGLGAYRDRPEAPLTGPNPGPDPDALSDDTRELIMLVVTALGGRRFS